MNILNGFKQLSALEFKTTFILGFALIFTGCSSDSSGGGKKYRVTIKVPHCREQIKKSFSSQAKVCEFLAFEARNVGCLYNELQNEFYRHGCNDPRNSGNRNDHLNSIPPKLDGTGSADIFIEDYSAGKDDYSSGNTNSKGAIDDRYDDHYIGGPLPSNPRTSQSPKHTKYSDMWADLVASQGSLTDYYSVDASDCFATIKGTNDVVDLCVYDRPELRPIQPSTIEKDAPIPTIRRTEEPRADLPPAVAARPTSEAADSPASSNTLAYNLIEFGSSNLRIELIGIQRIPSLKIISSVSRNSPIYGLRHDSPGTINSITDLNISTDCPLKSQLTTSGNNIFITLLPEASSTELQRELCLKFFENFSELSSFEFKYEQPLEMTNGTKITQPFKLQNNGD